MIISVIVLLLTASLAALLLRARRSSGDLAPIPVETQHGSRRPTGRGRR